MKHRINPVTNNMDILSVCLKSFSAVLITKIVIVNSGSGF